MPYILLPPLGGIKGGVCAILIEPFNSTIKEVAHDHTPCGYVRALV